MSNINTMPLTEKWKHLKQYKYNFLCYDDPDYYEYASNVNSKISQEARELHDESIIIDALAFFIDKYNWHVGLSGSTAISITIQRPRDLSLNNFMANVQDLHMACKRSPDKLMIVSSVEDIFKAKKEGKTGLIISAQDCGFMNPLHADMDVACRIFEKIGLRIMQIAYNNRSFAAEGCFTKCDAGLSNDGRNLIRAMEDNNITLDLSHVGDRSALEALDMATKPVIFSHSGPRGLFNSLFPERNITDEHIKKCAATGGVVCANGFMPTLFDGKTFPTVNSIVDAICYMVDLVGVDHVGVGTDSMAQPGSYNIQNTINQTVGWETQTNHPYVIGFDKGMGKYSVFTDGMYGMANLPNLTWHLIKRGFSKDEIKKIMGLNLIRVFKATWK